MSLPLDFGKYRRQLSYLRRTVEQIQKDFQIFEIDITFSGDPEAAYGELSAQVQSIIATLSAGNPERLMNLLYRIDLKETDLRHAVNERADFIEYVTQKILERELQKVILRDHFKNAQDSEGFSETQLPDG